VLPPAPLQDDEHLLPALLRKLPHSEKPVASLLNKKCQNHLLFWFLLEGVVIPDTAPLCRAYMYKTKLFNAMPSKSRLFDAETARLSLLMRVV
jgi:hypothetical protein